MTTLAIRDLEASVELDRKAMSGVFGGTLGFPFFSQVNNVADLDVLQGFGIATTAANSSMVSAAQGNANGNGVQWTDQSITTYQTADAYTSDMGNIDVKVG